jgi:hypothetical protein
VRIVVTGDRNARGYAAASVGRALSLLHTRTPIAMLMHGGARGVDARAAKWARDNGVPARQFDADWATYGRAAGPIRNSFMLDARPDLVVAFPGGVGTADCVRQAEARGIRVLRVPA